MSRFTLVEDVMNVYDENRLWYYLEGYNGYELSNDNYIRSMKHYKKYPFGILIQPKKNKSGDIISPEDPIYEMSNNNNERCTLHLSEIRYIAQHPKYQVTGYPRKTYNLDISSRNQRCFIKKKQSTPPGFNTEHFSPKFTIIK